MTSRLLLLFTHTIKYLHASPFIIHFPAVVGGGVFSDFLYFSSAVLLNDY